MVYSKAINVLNHFGNKELFEGMDEMKERNSQLHKSSLRTAILAQRQLLYERSDTIIGLCSLKCEQCLQALP
ncbi:hypothetical protein BDR22DRAFT_836781 [Usnea florida]